MRWRAARWCDDDTAVRGALPTFDVLDGEASRVAAASEGLLFLPYLQGERTPIWDVSARGAYVGLGLNHGRGHLWRALLEGIALGFVDCQAVLEDGGVVLREVVAANGGGKSALFRQILCDALGVPLAYAAKGGGTVAGAAVLAGAGRGRAREAPKTRESVARRAGAARAERGGACAVSRAPGVEASDVCGAARGFRGSHEFPQFLTTRADGGRRASQVTR